MSHTVAGATIQGPDYRGLKDINQDSLYSISENGVTVIAVSDGAGSLINSHIGAQISSQISAEETLDSIFDGNTLEESVRIGVEKAREALLSRDDYETIGCTLAVAVISDQGWAAGVVGDAFAVISYSETQHEMIQPIQESEFANITKLLTSNSYNPIYVSGTETPLGISVASDGLIPSAIENGKALPGFWSPLIDRVSEEKIDISSFLTFIKNQGKISDDTTLIIATS